MLREAAARRSVRAVANIALPQLKAPAIDVGALLRSPFAGVGAAAILFSGAAFALLQMLGPFEGGASHARVSLDAAFRAAPAGWREALKPLHGPVTPQPDVVRLSERPLAPLAGTSWNGPASPAIRGLAGGALPQAPITGFFAPGPGGPLPIIAQDGRTPAQVYARPFNSNGRPKIGVVVGGLGLNARATR